MSPVAIHHLVGKFTVRASFGTITYGPRKGAKKGATTARVLVLPDLIYDAELADWLQEQASEIRKASNASDHRAVAMRLRALAREMNATRDLLYNYGGEGERHAGYIDAVSITVTQYAEKWEAAARKAGEE